MRESEIDDLAKGIRKLALQICHKANASHIGGALSIADLLAVLYHSVLQKYPHQPENACRDRFLLSKGHACSALYAVLALEGYYSVDELETFATNGSLFTTHVSHSIPGVELSTGSLGHALGVGCGIALAAKRKNASFQVYVMISDGELDEGSNWEAILFAPHHKLDNLTLIVDYNKFQSLGRTEEVLPLHALADKFCSFNWAVQQIDGHDCHAIYNALTNSGMAHAPRVIIADTIKGKGVDFMENRLEWHYRAPNEAQLLEALRQIDNAK